MELSRNSESFASWRLQSSEVRARRSDVAKKADDEPLLHRARRNKFIDYLSLDWKASFANGLKPIRLGPDGRKDLAEKFIADIRAKYLAAGGTLVVDQSMIPYRG